MTGPPMKPTRWLDTIRARWLTDAGWPDAYVDVGGVVHKVRADGRLACTGAGPVVPVPTVTVWSRGAACGDCEWPHPTDGGRA